MTEFSIDLKYFLWTTEEAIWEEYATGVLEDIQARLENEAPVTVVTRPKNEIRYGRVQLWKQAGTYRATVLFETAWDDVEDLASALGLDPFDDLKLVEGLTPRMEDGDPGVSRREDLEADDFEELMGFIDDVENELIGEAAGAWDRLKERVAERKP